MDSDCVPVPDCTYSITDCDIHTSCLYMIFESAHCVFSVKFPTQISKKLAAVIKPTIALVVLKMQNSPLYLRTVADPMDAELSHKLMYMLHTSLDVVEEKINSPVPGK